MVDKNLLNGRLAVCVTARVTADHIFVWPLFVQICPGSNSESRKNREPDGMNDGPMGRNNFEPRKMVEAHYDMPAGSDLVTRTSLRLFYAVRRLRTDAAKALLEGGANLEAPGRNRKRLPYARNKSPGNRDII